MGCCDKRKAAGRLIVSVRKSTIVQSDDDGVKVEPETSVMRYEKGDLHSNYDLLVSSEI